MKKVIFAGNAVTADILNAYLAQDDRYQVVGLTVDDEYVEQGGIEGFQTIGLSRLVETFSPDECSVIMAMGYGDINRSRENMFHRIKNLGYRIETYVHPDAKVFTEYPLSEGCVILPSALIEPHVRVGANTMVWGNVTLAHHSSIAENCWIASGAVVSGHAKVERNAFIGVNATIVNEVVVGEYAIVGAGALIVKNAKPSSVHLSRSSEVLRYSSQEYMKYVGF